MSQKNILYALLIVCFSGCISFNKEIVLTSQYKQFKTDNIVLRPMKKETLPNGLKIIFVKDDSIPIVRLSMLVKTRVNGGIHLLISNLLEQGTVNRDATRIAEDSADIAANFQANSDHEFTFCTMSSLTKDRTQLLDLFSDIILNPSFDSKEISRMQGLLISSYKKQNDKASTFASDQMGAFLYGHHPYGIDNEQLINNLQKFKRDDIVINYARSYKPNNSILTVVGNFDNEFEKKIVSIYSDWMSGLIEQPIAHDPPEKADQIKMRVLIKKKQEQAEIRMGRIGIARSNPDHLKLKLASEILGGGFVGKLNQRLRDQLGLTYSISAFNNALLDIGDINISTFTKNESCGQTVEEIINVLTRFYNGGITEEELKSAKNQLIGQFPRAIETVGGYAQNILYLDFYGISMSYLTEFNKNIEKITVNEVNEVIRKYYNPQTFKILVYGNESVPNQLGKYSPEVIRLR